MKKLFLILLVVALPAFGQKVTATNWLVADGDGRIIESRGAEEQRSIASITKLVTAMVVLDANQDLDEYIKPYTRKELLQLMLIKSDNRAAEVLCENYPLGRSSCIAAMNLKVWKLGLANTKFVDPSGLNIMNISTANELVPLVLEASKYPEIVEASHTAQVKIQKKKSYFTFNNTNPLVATKEFIISKTGYIRASGGCIVAMVETKIGRRIVVLLNSKNTYTRIPEVYQLASAFN
jgi:D-alanyl-D-alanine endopeptidase (penicillin-binding protein 7)